MEMKLIYNRAWSFHKTTGIELEELISEATAAYLEAEKMYNGSVKFTTYAYRVMTNRLTEFCEWTYKQKIIEDPENRMDWVVNKVKIQIDVLTDFSKFSKGIQDVFKIVFDPERDFQIDKIRDSKTIIFKQLQKQGWPPYKIYAIFNDIRELLKKVPEGELF